MTEQLQEQYNRYAGNLAASAAEHAADPHDRRKESRHDIDQVKVDAIAELATEAGVVLQIEIEQPVDEGQPVAVRRV